MRRTLSLDFETPYGKDFSVVDLGYDRYARDERCQPYMISVCDGSEVWAGHPNEFNFTSLEGADLVSANSAFDEEISLGAAERGLFTVPGLSRWGMDHWYCSSNMSSYLWNVRSLKDGCEMGLNINISKGVRDRAKDKSVEDMKREGWYGDMVKYAKEDAINCWRLWDKHNAKWPAFERQLSRLTIDQGRHGVRLDVVALHHGIEQLQKVIFTATANLPWITRGRLPGSPLGIAEECRMAGIPPPPVKAHNPEAAAEWEEAYAPRYGFVMALRNLRKAKKALATLETMKLRLRPDETMAFSLKYAGAHTLRWSGDSGINMQNLAKEPLLIDPSFSFIFDQKIAAPLNAEFSAEHAGARANGVLKNGVQYFDFRGLFIAREGMSIASVDEGQIEPRCLNWLAGNHQLLKLLAEGFAIYEAHARTTMGWTGGRLKNENPKLYGVAKVRVISGGYQVGWKKFIGAAMQMAQLDITEGDMEFAKAVALDGLTHRRTKVKDKWHFESIPNPSVVALSTLDNFPLVLPAEGMQWEDCVFVATEGYDAHGKPKAKIKALGVYGMRSRITIQEFRASNPLIVDLWNGFKKALQESVGHELTIVGPHGGTLVYKDIKASRVKKKDDDSGEEYTGTQFTCQDGWKRAKLYGGLLTENLVQWVARMVFAEHKLALHNALKAEDVRQGVLWSAHDEAIAEIIRLKDEAEVAAQTKYIESFLSVTPTWMPGLPLKAECSIKQRYFK